MPDRWCAVEASREDEERHVNVSDFGRRPELAPAVVPADRNGEPRLSVAERYAQGVAARQRAARRDHASWSPAPDRPDPITLLGSQDGSRLSWLLPIRYGRMVASPFAFYRGSAIIMAHDLAHTPTSGITTQLCGDAHLSNFGIFASPERRILFDINDFDETHPGPWEWDVKRLAASLVLAGRENSFSAAICRDLALATVRAYREHMHALAAMRDLEVWYSRVDAEETQALTDDAARKQARQLVVKAKRTDHLKSLAKLTTIVDSTRRIVEDPPLIIRLKGADESAGVQQLFQDYRQTLREEYRVLLDRYHLVDAAHKVVGVGSVGMRCVIGLLEGRDADDPLFLQLKEAGPSVLAAHFPQRSYENNGQRVVTGQRLMQAASDIFLGWIRTTDGREYYWRQYRDMKASVDIATMSPAVLEVYARTCALALARAHARCGDRIAIAGYLGETDRFEKAVASFAMGYADQVERDYALLVTAVRQGRVSANTMIDSR